MNQPANSATRWVVSGRVQRVGFRWFTTQQARALQLAGWVTNLPDGRVEVVAKGPAEGLAALEQAIRRGPAGANVESVEKSEIPHESVPDNTFRVR